MNTTRWVIPEAAEPLSLAGDGPVLAVAAGRRRRIGLLDNTKDNAQTLLQLTGEQVARTFDAELIYRRKGNATVGAPAEMLDDLAREADCVLTAMAD